MRIKTATTSLLPWLVASYIVTSSNSLRFQTQSHCYRSTNDSKGYKFRPANVRAHAASESQKNDQAVGKKIINARTVAAVALMEATSKKVKEEFSLRRLETKDYNLLELRDRRFARKLASTVERRKGQIDKILQMHMKKPLQKARRKPDALVQAALRIGAAQLLFLETPAHAAVKETVDVLRNTRIKIPESKIKFVNAVLRRIERNRSNSNLVEAETSPHDNIASWLLKEWRKSWGEDKLAAIAQAAMVESPIYISVNHRLGASPEEKMEKRKSIQEAFCASAVENQFSSSSAEVLSHGSIYIDKVKFPGAISKWPLYQEGEWWVQDASATLPAIALYNSLLRDNNNQQDEHSIVDMCSAPGGKTAQLLSLGFPTVTAVEASGRRAKQLRSNLDRLHLGDRCTVFVGDGCDWIPDEGPETVSGILLDVPCSATGTASRRPDVLRKEDNLAPLLEVQYSLAEHCVDNLLKPGGVLIYATCSLQKQESEDQVRKLLERKDGARMKILRFSLGEIPGFDEAINELGCLRVIPGWLDGKLSTCDGFFVARLQKE